MGSSLRLAITVERLREYGQRQLNKLKLYLADAGIDAIGGDADYGAFLSVRHTNASKLAKKLAESSVITDARGERLRLAPIASLETMSCEHRLLPYTGH